MNGRILTQGSFDELKMRKIDLVKYNILPKKRTKLTDLSNNIFIQRLSIAANVFTRKSIRRISKDYKMSRRTSKDHRISRRFSKNINISSLENVATKRGLFNIPFTLSPESIEKTRKKSIVKQDFIDTQKSFFEYLGCPNQTCFNNLKVGINNNEITFDPKKICLDSFVANVIIQNLNMGMMTKAQNFDVEMMTQAQNFLSKDAIKNSVNNEICGKTN